MREIKFRAWDLDNCQIFTIDDIGDVSFYFENDGSLSLLICDSGENPNCVFMQYTGRKDKNGVEIYEDDLLNVFFTSSNGEHIHDCIYRVTKGALGGIQLVFVRLLWSCHGHNQYPASTTLCERHKTLDYEYEENEIKLKVPDSWGENHLHGNRWKQNDKSFYFEIIGNIYENPELKD
jgi:hypothetical protein